MTNRNDILDAALAVFAETGVAQTTLEQVADKAGCETAAVRALFVDANTLLRELLEEVSTPLLNAISMAVEKYDHPRDMLKESMRLYDHWLSENPEYVRLFQRCTLDDPDALSVIFQKSMYPSEFYERIDAWIKEGKIKAKDTFSLILILDSIVMMPHFSLPVMSQAFPQGAEEILRQRLDTLWEVLEHGLFAD